MSRKNNKDEKGPGIGWVLGAAAGAAIVGAAAYGVKKLFDYIDEQERQVATNTTNREYEPEEKADQGGGNSDQDADEARNQTANEGPEASPPQATNQLASSLKDDQIPLQFRLEDYHNGYVNIARSEMDRAKKVVDDIKDAILKHFQKNDAHMITELKDCGSVVEGLKVVRPEEFDVMIPLHVNPGLFTLQYDPQVPGFYVLKQHVFPETFYSQPLEKFLRKEADSGESYLSPDMLRNYFQSNIQRAINGITQYEIKSGKKGPSILLEVTYDGGKKTSIDFVPVMVVEEKQVVAKPHPEFLHSGNKDFEKYWRESFSVKEFQVMASLPSDACHKKCLKIVKGARLNNPSQMGMLNSYIYKTMLLHMLESTDEEEWQEGCLSERFVDFLDLLHSHLRKGHLPHRFNPEVNLLDQYSPAAIEVVKNYLGKILANNRWGSLLKTMY